MEKLIDQQAGEVFLRSDFDRGIKASPSQITRCLSVLCKEGRLYRLGYGVYSRARISRLTGQPITRVPLDDLAAEIFKRLKVEIESSRDEVSYMNGRTTQVPAKLVVRCESRVSRKISVGNQRIFYETA